MTEVRAQIITLWPWGLLQRRSTGCYEGMDGETKKRLPQGKGYLGWVLKFAGKNITDRGTRQCSKADRPT